MVQARCDSDAKYKLSWGEEGLTSPRHSTGHFGDIFQANLLTDAKHSAFSTNHLTDTNKTKHDYNQQQDKNLNDHRRTTDIWTN